MGNGLWVERPLDTDICYDPDAYDDKIDQSPTWSSYAAAYSGPINLQLVGRFTNPNYTLDIWIWMALSMWMKDIDKGVLYRARRIY